MSLKSQNQTMASLSGDAVKLSAGSAKVKKEQSDFSATYGTALTLSNTMIGAALLSFPFTIVRLGWIAALIIMAFAFTYTLFGFYAIIDTAHFTQSRTLRGCIVAIFGKKIAMGMDVCIVLMYTGLLVVYVSICGDYISACIVGFSQGKASFNITYIKIILGAVLIPTVVLKSPAALSSISAFCILFVVLTVFSVLGYFIAALVRQKVDCNVEGITETELYKKALSSGFKTPVNGYSTIGNWDKFPNPMNISKPAHEIPWKAFLEIVRRVSVFMPLFGCHPTIAPLLFELQGPPNKRRLLLKKAITIAIVTSLTLYLINGFCSAFMFNQVMQANVLISFPPTTIYMTVIRLLYVCVIALSFAIIMFPIRVIIMSWWNLDKNTRKGGIIFIVIGVSLTVLAVLMSSLIPSIDTVFNAIAALFGIAVYWLVPLFLRWKAPEVEARSTVPRGNDDEEIGYVSPDDDGTESVTGSAPTAASRRGRGDSIAVGAFAFLGMTMGQARTMSKVFTRERSIDNRERTRSQIRTEQRAKETRNRAATLAVAQKTEAMTILSIKSYSPQTKAADQQSNDRIGTTSADGNASGASASHESGHLQQMWSNAGQHTNPAAQTLTLDMPIKAQMHPTSVTAQGSANLSAGLDGKSISSAAQSRYRAMSIADARPTCTFDLLSETTNSCNAQLLKDPNLPDDMRIALEVAAELGQKTETVRELSGAPAEPDMSEAWRVTLMAKMTRCRKITIIISACAIVAMNFTAFFLSTFVNTDTFKWIFVKS